MDSRSAVSGSGKPRRRPETQNMLRTYYVADEKSRLDDDDNFDPYDIDKQHFNSDLYFDKLLKERTLTELMDRERDVCREIQSLDSDMQTLVYENYNKFISATDTIRKMKSDFCKMEEEMDHLATKMTVITDFSAKISSTLQDRRQEISKLSGVHTLLNKLNFLFELPTKLTSCIEAKEYGQAVRCYTRAQQVLRHYQHMPSFEGIHHDCEKIVSQMKMQLREQFQNNEASPKQLAETVDLLLQLNEPAEVLCDEYLTHASKKLNEDLSELNNQIMYVQRQNSGTASNSEFENTLYAEQDILAFVDLGCNHFLGNMCLLIGAYLDMFMTRPRVAETFTGEDIDTIPLRKLITFVTCHMNEYFGYVERRVQLERETGDNTLLVRALDRFYRRLQAMSKLLPETDFARVGTEIVSRAGKDRCDHYLEALMQHFTECMTDIRQHLVATRLVGTQQTGGNFLSQLQTTISSVIEQVRSVLSSLQAFIKPDITFAMKPHFNEKFRRKDVREGLVIAFFSRINTFCLQFCEGSCDKSVVPPMLLLILSKLCLDFESSAICYIMTVTDDLFGVDGASLSVSQLCNDAKQVAQKLLDHYVWVQGCMISQMLRKSVDTRDWISSIEPRNVRAVMKRVVEDVTSIDGQVGQLFEEGLRKARSSDSSRRQFSQSASRLHARSNWSSYGPSTLDDSLLSNIHKLFSERIEIFSSVEFSKVSVLTGIIKISLKTFLECVRLRTFGRYGLQQIQVDTHYLQLYLWRFVADENLVHVLLDEILSSAVLRCLDPAMMEPSVVDVICERS